jgi:hypothetical protein
MATLACRARPYAWTPQLPGLHFGTALPGGCVRRRGQGARSNAGAVVVQAEDEAGDWAGGSELSRDTR